MRLSKLTLSLCAMGMTCWIGSARAQAFFDSATYPHGSLGLPLGVAGDVDRDGDIDLITNPVRPASQNPQYPFGLWINDGDGNFAEETALRVSSTTNPWRLGNPVLADLDLDGDLDVVYGGFDLLVGSHQVVRIWINDGSGNFRDASSTLAPKTQFSAIEDLVVADLDGDRFPDIVVATAYDVATPGQLCTVFMNTRQGSFKDETSSRVPSTRASRVRVADCDSDGDVDLLFYTKGPFSFLLNDGRGYFKPSQKSFGVSFTAHVILDDFNGDRHVDALVFHLHFDHLWINDGTGTFKNEASLRLPKPTGYTGTVGVVGDFNADGHLDIFGHVHGDSGPTYPGHYNLMMNDGKGYFRLIEAVLPQTPVLVTAGGFAADIDGDDDDDYIDNVVRFPLVGNTVMRKNLWREIHSKAPPKLGQPYGIDTYTGQTPAVLLPFLSLGRSRLPLAGVGTFRLDLATTVALGAYPLDKPGGVQVPLPIPNDNALIGLPLSTQAAVIDTKALRVTGFTNARTEKIEK